MERKKIHPSKIPADARSLKKFPHYAIITSPKWRSDCSSLRSDKHNRKVSCNRRMQVLIQRQCRVDEYA